MKKPYCPSRAIDAIAKIASDLPDGLLDGFARADGVWAGRLYLNSQCSGIAILAYPDGSWTIGSNACANFRSAKREIKNRTK